MVIKSKTGRRRYIVFRIKDNSEITFKDLTYTFNRLLPFKKQDIENMDIGSPITGESTGKINYPKKRQNNNLDKNPLLHHKLKYFDGEYGILLCPHWLKPFALETMVSIGRVGYLNKTVKIEPIGTSGTLKKARKKYLH